MPIAALAGCSGSPSDTDIQTALQATGQLDYREVLKVEQSSCTDAGEGRYRCTFKATLRNGNWVRDREKSFLFEKRPSGWAVAGN
jgi:hypothetical protein